MSEEKVIKLNEFKVMMEEVKAQNRRTLEVIQGNQEQTNKNFERGEGRMVKLEGRMDRMEGSFKGVKEQVGKLTERVETLTGRVNILTERVDDLKVLTSQLQEGQAEIKAALADKVSRGEFVQLEKRVIRLERKAI